MQQQDLIRIREKNRPLLRGWVYVLVNEAMPGLVKVGFSTKDPFLRALELGGTGNPHHYNVAFDVLVLAPREVEQRAHFRLASFREGKEWFRCSIEQAVAAVKLEASEAVLLQWHYFGDEVLTEEYREGLIRQREEEDARRLDELRATNIQKARARVAWYSEGQFLGRFKLLDSFILKTENFDEARKKYGRLVFKTPLTPEQLVRAKLALSDNERIKSKMAEIILSGEYVLCRNLNCYTALKINHGVDNHLSCPVCGKEIRVPASYAEGDSDWLDYCGIGMSVRDYSWTDVSYITEYPNFLNSYEEFVAQMAE